MRQIVPVARPSLSKADLGEAARQIIAARLMLAGLKVFRPMNEDTPVDLLVLGSNGEARKCQCKYLFPSAKGSHMLRLCAIRKNGPNRKAHGHVSTRSEMDFFLGYCLDNDAVYVIPYDECGGRREVALWILREPVGKNGRANFDGKRWLRAYHLLK